MCVSSWMISCVLRAMREDISLGSAMASSSELVCRLWVWPSVAAGSVTAMAGAALTPRLARLVGEARIVWLSLAVTGPVGLLVPLAQPGWGIALLVVGMGMVAVGLLFKVGAAPSKAGRTC